MKNLRYQILNLKDLANKMQINIFYVKTIFLSEDGGNEVRSTAPVAELDMKLGGMFGLWGKYILFVVLGENLSQGREDPWNSNFSQNMFKHYIFPI